MIILFKGSFFLDIFETINEISTLHIVDIFSLCVIHYIQPYVFFEFFLLLNIKRSKNISVSTALSLTWKHIRFLALLLNIPRNSFFFKENKNENNKHCCFFWDCILTLYIGRKIYEIMRLQQNLFIIYTDITGTWWLDQVVCSIVQRYWAIGHRCQPI